MTYNQYNTWCNERACDGCWGMIEAMACIDILNKIKKVPFWKREKEWQNKYAKDVYEQIVKPINEKIESFKANKI